MTQTHKLSHGALATATPLSPAPNSSKTSKYSANPSGIVVSLSISMGWQLAVVVLAPLLGGHFIDKKMDSAPIWTIVGLAVAMAGMIVVVKRTLQQLNKYMEATPTKDEKTAKVNV